MKSVGCKIWTSLEDRWAKPCQWLEAEALEDHGWLPFLKHIAGWGSALFFIWKLHTSGQHPASSRAHRHLFAQVSQIIQYDWVWGPVFTQQAGHLSACSFECPGWEALSLVSRKSWGFRTTDDVPGDPCHYGYFPQKYSGETGPFVMSLICVTEAIHLSVSLLDSTM